MFLQILAALLCLFGALVQFAAYRSPDIYDFSVIRAARRLTIVSLVVFAVYILDGVFFLSYGADPVVCVVAAIFALGQVLFGLNTLLEDFHKGHKNGSHA